MKAPIVLQICVTNVDIQVWEVVHTDQFNMTDLSRDAILHSSQSMAAWLSYARGLTMTIDIDIIMLVQDLLDPMLYTV